MQLIFLIIEFGFQSIQYFSYNSLIIFLQIIETFFGIIYEFDSLIYLTYKILFIFIYYELREPKYAYYLLKPSTYLQML